MVLMNDKFTNTDKFSGIRLKVPQNASDVMT